MTLIQFIAFATLTFFHCLTCAQLIPPPSTGISLSLNLISALSPQSPIYPGNLSPSERIQKMLQISEARIMYLTSTMFHNDEMFSTNTLQHRRFYAYFAKISLGSPKQSQFLAVDTGSGLIWTQCQPCVNCYNQSIPIFDPQSSTSYKKLLAGDPHCKENQTKQIVKPDCSYELVNNGESLTIGFASTETFTFLNNKGQEFTLPNIVFGCSNNNTRMPFVGTKVSGVLGLNTAPFSLGIQLKEKISNTSRFSYCLHSSSQPEKDSTSLLKFGKGAVFPNGKKYQTTSILKNNFNDYQLSLESISIGEQPVTFPPKTPAVGRNGTFLDFGSIVTFMETDPYNVVMEKFDEYYRSIGHRRVSPPPETEGKFDHCYNYGGNMENFVSMTYHFNGNASLKVDPLQLYLVIGDAFCVTIISSKSFTGTDFTVIGALHQQNTRFVFDLDKNVVQFAPEDCSKDK
ncbi:hypothetical protein TanjilG_31853 [Lupinus angustifolius]|uniref:Peptidase A1 domain-containing protein n=1 Tax=Lupinus angustifolius TaxID=3871 RepID=A0A394D9V1_LUPAN|nr:PREDICTED: aspartic proteinase CDR1-like [Lupinus angustifolius]OIW19979.1 hypothetical protein TanjilG_31853 [Lupinus angustifolius]